MFDFEPQANLQWVDYSNNAINQIENAVSNKYLKYLNLDNNNIQTIEGLAENSCLRVTFSFI
jgi:Leucine-rich repeat (LRR) protein